MEGSRSKDILQTLVFIVIVFAINVLGSIQFGRIDLTEEKMHTLSESSIDLLENELEGPLSIFVYLKNDEFPADLERFRKTIEEKLEEMKAYSNGLLKYEFVNPDEDEVLREDLYTELNDLKLSRKKMLALSAQSDQEIKFWPSVKMVYNGEETAALQLIGGGADVYPWQLANAINQIEFMFLQKFQKLVSVGRPSVGFLHGHQELIPNQTISIRGHLNEFYKVEDVIIKDTNGVEQLNALNGLAALIVAKPRLAFSDKENFIIDQFIMDGGKVAWLVDPVNVFQDTLYRKGLSLTETYPLSISDMLYSYGARLNNDVIIDQKCALALDFTKGEMRNWIYHPTVIDNGDIVTKGLNPIRARFASSVDTVGHNNNEKRILLTSSTESIAHRSPTTISLQYFEPRSQPNFSGDKAKSHNMAVLLKGTFNSFFKSSIDPKFKNNEGTKILESSKSTSILVIGDGDLIRNEINPKKLNSPISELNLSSEFGDVISPDIYTDRKQRKNYIAFSNTDFFMNAFDELMGKEKLIQLRGKEYSIRPLNKIKIEKDKGILQFLNVVLPIIALLLYGGIQYYIRRRKFAK